MGKEETTIIAAAIETIERVGPSDAKIKIEKIEDVRGSKREYIIERAKKLLGKIEGSAETREIEDAVKISSKLSRLKEYGNESLPAGDISGKEIIVVEGRADVVNLIKQGIKNVIGMNGSIFPETIKELAKEKEITLFVDGDRGGDLIAKTAIENSNISYVTKAPDGKEVEELTGKEILMCLRKKIKAEEFLKKSSREKSTRKSTRRKTDNRKTLKSREEKQGGKDIKKLGNEEIDKIREMSEELIGTKGALLLDKNLEKIRKVPLSQLSRTRAKDVYAIVIDGTVNLSIIKSAEKLRCQHLAAKNFSYTNTYIDLVSL
jgi:DNA primase